MLCFNQRFLVAPMIALAASAMLVSQAHSRGFRGGPVGGMNYHFPAYHPGYAAHPAGIVNHSGTTTKPSGAINHRPAMTTKPISAKSSPAMSKRASTGKTRNVANGKPATGGNRRANDPRPDPQSGGQQQQQQGGDSGQQQQQQGPNAQQQQQQQDGSGQQGQQQQGSGQQQQQQQTVNVNPGSADSTSKVSWGWWQWNSLPAAAGGIASGGGTPSIIMASPSGGGPVVEPPDLAGAIHELGRLRGRQTQVDEKESDSRTTTSPEQKRPQANLDELRHHLKPALSEIYSGNPLNFLLDDLQGFQALGGRGPQVVLDADLLRHINVIWKQDAGNIGLLKDGGRLIWPTALRGVEYQESREALDALAPKAIQEAVKGGAKAETLEPMKNALDNLRIRLAGNIDKLSAPRHIEAKRFLGQLDDALKVLPKPHASEYFSGKYSAQGKTVADLVQHMTKHGLKFAPAVAGDETAYESLHRALAVYDVAAHYSKMDKEKSED